MTAVQRVVVRGVDVEFPFRPYDCQHDYMEKVILALDTGQDAALESPTGTGKTLSLLCATLAWLQKRKTQISPSVQDVLKKLEDPSKGRQMLTPRVYYCSRTHSQLAQVVRELNRTVYKNIKTAVVGSRDQLCIHERVSKEKDNLVKEPIEFLDATYTELGRVPDIEDIVNISKKHSYCPFYRTRQMQETAELVLLPYNYLVDPRLRRTHNIDLKGSIVIFDEAHNLESVCEESSSVTFSTTDVAGCIQEAKQVLAAILEKQEEVREEADNTNLAFGATAKKEKAKEFELSAPMVARLLENLQSLENAIDNLAAQMDCAGSSMDAPGGMTIEKLDGRVFAGERLVQLLQTSGFRRDALVADVELLIRTGQYLSDKAAEDGISTATSAKEPGKRLQDFASLLAAVYADTHEDMMGMGRRDPNAAAKNFRMYVVREETKITFHYWCFVAGQAMRSLKSRGVRTVIVTSGTLAPLDAFAASLGLTFSCRLEGLHAAKDDQVKTIVLTHSKSGHQIVGTFESRNTEVYRNGVGEALLKVVSQVPQGVLVFFSSYALMRSLLKYWREWRANPQDTLTLYQQLERCKSIFEEPQNRLELKTVMLHFDIAVREDKRGALLFAVCRGKVSEGIDFADAHSRAVVVIGIPYPPFVEPRVILKRLFISQQQAEALKRNGGKKDDSIISGDDWYSTEGFRAVNQALGRVLRHIDDYGVVILMDGRYGQAPRSRFPKWMRHSIETMPFDGLETTVAKFFKQRGNYAPAFLTSKPGVPTLAFDLQSKLVPKKPTGNAGSKLLNEIRAREEKQRRAVDEALLAEAQAYAQALQEKEKREKDAEENEEVEMASSTNSTLDLFARSQQEQRRQEQQQQHKDPIIELNWPKKVDKGRVDTSAKSYFAACEERSQKRRLSQETDVLTPELFSSQSQSQEKSRKKIVLKKNTGFEEERENFEKRGEKRLLSEALDDSEQLGLVGNFFHFEFEVQVTVHAKKPRLREDEPKRLLEAPFVFRQQPASTTQTLKKNVKSEKVLHRSASENTRIDDPMELLNKSLGEEGVARSPKEFKEMLIPLGLHTTVFNTVAPYRKGEKSLAEMLDVCKELFLPQRRELFKSLHVILHKKDNDAFNEYCRRTNL